jgi:hypothetical protein
LTRDQGSSRTPKRTARPRVLAPGGLLISVRELERFPPRSLCALGDAKLDCLAFLQTAKAACLDSRKMHLETKSLQAEQGLLASARRGWRCSLMPRGWGGRRWIEISHHLQKQVKIRALARNGLRRYQARSTVRFLGASVAFRLLTAPGLRSHTRSARLLNSEGNFSASALCQPQCPTRLAYCDKRAPLL